MPASLLKRSARVGPRPVLHLIEISLFPHLFDGCALSGLRSQPLTSCHYAASTHMTSCPSFLSLAASLFSLVRHQDLLIAISTSEPGLKDRRSPCSQSLA